jgi:uncharacterized membrane protein
MREFLHLITEYTVVVINVMATLVIVGGTIQAFVAGLALFANSTADQPRQVWLRYARWLVAGLTFQLAADIVATSIASNTWQEIGKLAVVALIRTFLNFFLDRDLASSKTRSAANAG